MINDRDPSQAEDVPDSGLPLIDHDQRAFLDFGGELSRRVSTTRSPSASGETSCARNWSTLGPRSRVTASAAPKIQIVREDDAAVRPRQSFITSASAARGSPTPQWTASCPCRLRISAHRGERFMSMSTFVRRRGGPRVPPCAKPRTPAAGGCPEPQGRDHRRGSPPRTCRPPAEPRMVPTVTRIPRMQGRPPITAGSRVMRSKPGISLRLPGVPFTATPLTAGVRDTGYFPFQCPQMDAKRRLVKKHASAAPPRSSWRGASSSQIVTLSKTVFDLDEARPTPPAVACSARTRS